MKKLFLSLAIIAGCTNTALSQALTCGTDAGHRYLLSQNPDYAHIFKEQTRLWAQQQQHQQDRIIQTQTGVIYEIPVVVHIIHSGQAVGTLYNPSDQQIQNWVSYFNDVYAAQSPLFADTLSGGVKVPIRLVLAARDPSCNPTTGIMRVNGSVYPNYPTSGVRYLGSGGGVSDTAIKALSVWPKRSYYNIWLVNMIDNGSWLGYATFPSVAPGMDGAMMSSSVAQQNAYFNPVFPHEIAHSMGLLHTFFPGTTSNCPPNNNCLVDGDGICDTEPHLMPISGCPSGTNSCTGLTFNNVQNNFMNYTNCRNRFTAGQKNKMVFTLLNYRYSLLNSYGGIVPGVNPPVIIPPINLCQPTSISNPTNNLYVGPCNFSLADMFVSTMSYVSDGYQYYVDHTLPNCLQPQAVAHLHKDSSYVFTVNTGGNPEYLRGWIDFNNNGIFENAELFINDNNVLQYEVHTATVSIPATASTCVPLRMRVVSDLIGSNPQPCGNPEYGQVEDFIVIVNTTEPTVTISTSAGSSVASGIVVTFTATATNGGSAPQYQWRKNGQLISGATAATWSATAGVTLLSGDVITASLLSNAACTQPGPAGSNAIALQVLPGNPTSLEQRAEEETPLLVYPNPTTGSFVLEGLVDKPGAYGLVLTNVLGQTVYEQALSSADKKLYGKVELPGMAQGIYYLSLHHNGHIAKTVQLAVVR